MKKLFLAFAPILFLIFILPACKKNNGNGSSSTPVTSGNNFTDSILNIVPQTIIDSLRSWGMTIYDGKQPPLLSGKYLVATDSCIFDNSGSNMAGQLFDEYQYTFTQENQSKLTIRVDADAINDPSGSKDHNTDSTATFLSGTGNNFTIFAEEKGVVNTSYGTSTYTELNILSGQTRAGGIAHFEYSIYMKAKNDPTGQLIPVNTSRIFLDGDTEGLARQTTGGLPFPTPGHGQTILRLVGSN